MPEDKLTRAERIRLESLAMSFNLNHFPKDEVTAKLWESENNQPPRPTQQDFLETAERIEAWLKRADFAEAN